MFYQYQNEIIASIAVVTLIIIYLLSRNKKRAKTPENPTAPKEIKEEELKKEEKTLPKEETPLPQEKPQANFEEMQDETLLGSEEGEFESSQEENIHKSIHKRELPQHGKITKENFKEFSGSKLLVAEDNFINQKVITGLLAGSGIEITLANDGQEALDILQENSDFFMILMDAHMPILDGFEATRAIRKNSNYDHIVIIALSGDTAADDIQKMKDAGMDETLEKPLRMDALYDMMYVYSGDDNHNEYVEVIMTKELHGDKGLQVCGGDEVFYREILEEFLSNYATSAEHLHTLLHEHKLAEADKLLLDILGITANIGAVHLNAIAKDIKFSLDDTDEKSYLTLVEQYKNHLENLIEDIKEYI